MTARCVGWCSRCRANRTFTAPVRVSPGGMLRARGACGECGARVRAILGKAAGR